MSLDAEIRHASCIFISKLGIGNSAIQSNRLLIVLTFGRSYVLLFCHRCYQKWWWNHARGFLKDMPARAPQDTKSKDHFEFFPQQLSHRGTHPAPETGLEFIFGYLVWIVFLTHSAWFHAWTSARPSWQSWWPHIILRPWGRSLLSGKVYARQARARLPTHRPWPGGANLISSQRYTSHAYTSVYIMHSDLHAFCFASCYISFVSNEWSMVETFLQHIFHHSICTSLEVQEDRRNGLSFRTFTSGWCSRYGNMLQLLELWIHIYT